MKILITGVAGFIGFSLANYLIDKQRKKNKKVIIGDVAKELGKMWKSLTDNQKQKYNAMKEKDQGRYSQQLEEYNSKLYNLTN